MKMKTFPTLALMLAGFWAPAFAQETSLAEAARKARDQKKEAPRAKRVFTNDDLPSPNSGGGSTVGSVAQGGGSGDSTAAGGAADQAGGDTAKPVVNTKNPAEEEAGWRKKFGELRAKIATAEKEVDIMQRELNLKQQQYYSDPNVALREQYSRGDINDGKTKLDDKKLEINALKQQLSELEDDLRRAGAPSSWARE